jgi:general secretion pathway protein G
LPPSRPKAIDELPNDAGITILEIMIVLVILSLIAVVSTIQIGQLMDRSKVDVGKLQLHQIENSLEVLKLDLRRYPTADEGLKLLLANENKVDGWRGPYLKSADLLLDPWGQPVGYSVTDGGGYQIRSLGSDRKEGGDGVAADVVLAGNS